jgi:hypothetical protein
MWMHRQRPPAAAEHEPHGDTYGTQLFRVLQESFVPGWANTYYPEDEGVARSVGTADGATE